METRYTLIDVLRGLAAISVALFHFFGYFAFAKVPQSEFTQAVFQLTRHGHLGVEVFFVISGFVIAMTSSRYAFSAGTGLRFLARRMTRLAPPYWATIALCVAYFAVGKSLGYFASTTVTAPQVFFNVLYLQDFFGFPSLLEPFWTLCIEVQFYLVHVLSLILLHAFFSGREHPARAAWLFLTAGLSIAVAYAEVPMPGWFVPFWYQFAIGGMCFEIARRRRVGPAVMVVTIAGLIVLELERRDGSATATAFAAIVLYVAAAANRWGNWLEATGLPAVGRISYSIYLIHAFVSSLVFLRLIGPLGASERSLWLMMPVMIFGTALGALSLYWFVERRAIRWSRRIRIA